MHKLKNKKMKTLPIGSLKPTGWLWDQMSLQMNGITRHLDEIWGSVSPYSDWLGGTENSWERPPYWLDGLVPLSYLLEDKDGIEKSNKWIEWTLNSQRPSGDFGPAYRTVDFDKTLFWPKFVMLKVLISYYESTEDKRVIPFMEKYFLFCKDKLNHFTMSGWDEARGADLAYSVYWLYDKTQNDELIYLIKKINKQTLNWVETFNDFPFVHPTGFYYEWETTLKHTMRTALYDVMQYHLTHVVNVAMAFKQPGMKYRISQNEEDLKSFYKGIEALQKYHGQVTGMFSGDEHLNGNNPTQGTELCAVVEMMFSLTTMLEITGDPKIADLLERIAYNALPATITDDFKGHQYDQQVNQVLASVAERNWYNNEPDSNIFGLEPNFGCCLANMHQGWPKFIRNALMINEHHVHAMTYMPFNATFEVDGQPVHIECCTNYPFDGEITFKFNTNEPVKLAFEMRKPGWCDDFQVTLNHKTLDVQENNQKLLIDRAFESGDEITLSLDMKIKQTKGWYHNGMTVERGPLLFALQIEQEWIKRAEGLASYPNYEVYPTSSWNYALIENTIAVQSIHPLSQQAFSSKVPPVVLKAKAAKVNTWFLEKNQAGDLPISPVDTVEDIEEVKLIPYGCAKLRVGLFPWREHE